MYSRQRPILPARLETDSPADIPRQFIQALGVALVLSLALASPGLTQPVCTPSAANLAAEFVSIEVPTTVRAFSIDDPFRVKVTVRNSGDTPWPAGTQACDVKLTVSDELPPSPSSGPYQPWLDTNIWRNAANVPQYVQKIPEPDPQAPVTIATNETHTFAFDIYPCLNFDTANRECPDRRPLTFQMVIGGSGSGMAPFSDAASGFVFIDESAHPLPGANSKLLAATVPGIMVAGETYPIRVKFRNTGALDWINDTSPATNFKLHIDNPARASECQDVPGPWPLPGDLWRIDDQQLTVLSDQNPLVPDGRQFGDLPAAPAAAATKQAEELKEEDDAIAIFEFPLIAPSDPGVYPLGFRMFQGGCGAGVNFFGEASDYQTVRVVDAQDLPDLPNIVHIVLDDLDYCDFAFVGNPDKTGPNVLSTPRVEELFLDAEGDVEPDRVIFERYYSNGSVCSPTRASLMTGKSPIEFGIHRTLQQKGLPEDQVFLAELLKAKGYTTGHFGKWHVGSSRQEHHPTSRGVDEAAVFYSGALDYEKFTLTYNDQVKCGTFPPSLQDCETVAIPDEEGCARPATSPYLDDAVTHMSTDFICRHKEDAQPFFLNVWFYTPHTPFTCPPDLLDTPACLRSCVGPGVHEGNRCTSDSECQDPSNSSPESCEIDDPWFGYQSMVEHIDGKIDEIVNELNLEGNNPRETLLIISSDNGGEFAGGQRSSCGGIFHPTGRKADFYERAIRVPLLMAYPGFGSALAEERRINEELAFSADLPATILDLVGYRLEDFDMVGESLLDLLQADTSLGRKGQPFFWEGKEDNFPPAQLGGSAADCEIRNNYAVLLLDPDKTESRKLLRENSPVGENLFFFKIEDDGAGESDGKNLLDDPVEWDKAELLQEEYFAWRKDQSAIPYRVALEDGDITHLQSTPSQAISSLQFPDTSHDGNVLLEEDYRFDIASGDFTFTAKVDLDANPINSGAVIVQKKCSWDLSVLSGPNAGKVQLRVWDRLEGCPDGDPALKVTSDAILTSGSGPVPVAFTVYGYRLDDSVVRLYVGQEVTEGVGPTGVNLKSKLVDLPIRFGNNDAYDLPASRRPFFGTISDVGLHTVALYKNQLPAFEKDNLTCMPPRPDPAP